MSHDPETPDLLTALVPILDHLTRDGEKHVAVGAHIDHQHHEVELAVRELTGHPCDVLTQFVAPTYWEVFGLGLRGTCHATDEPPSPVRVAFVLDRSHRCRTVLFRTGSPALEIEAMPDGRVADFCRHLLPRRATP